MLKFFRNSDYIAITIIIVVFVMALYFDETWKSTQNITPLEKETIDVIDIDGVKCIFYSKPEWKQANVTCINMKKESNNFSPIKPRKYFEARNAFS